MLTLHPNSHRRGACKRRKPSAVSSCQDLQQRLSLLEVDGVKALGEPAIDLRQELMLPEPAQAHDRTQLKRLRPLTLGQRQGLLELLTSTPMKMGYVRSTCIFSRKAFISIHNKWL